MLPLSNIWIKVKVNFLIGSRSNINPVSNKFKIQTQWHFRKHLAVVLARGLRVITVTHFNDSQGCIKITMNDYKGHANAKFKKNIVCSVNIKNTNT